MLLCKNNHQKNIFLIAQKQELIRLITCNILRFLERYTISLVHVFTQVNNGFSLVGEVCVGVQIVRRKTKSLSSVDQPRCPVVPTLLWVGLIRVIKVQVCSLGHNNLQEELLNYYTCMAKCKREYQQSGKTRSGKTRSGKHIDHTTH